MYVAILIMTVELMTKVETIEFLLPTYKDCMLVGSENITIKIWE